MLVTDSARKSFEELIARARLILPLSFSFFFFFPFSFLLFLFSFPPALRTPVSSHLRNHHEKTRMITRSWQIASHNPLPPLSPALTTKPNFSRP